MYTKQDLNDAIKHLEEKIDEIENCDCREEHKKLLEMLIDLKKIKRWDDGNTGAKDNF